MKNNNQCGKCGSRDVIRIPGGIAAHGSGNFIPTGGLWHGTAKVVRYLCGQCGFSEEWIESPEDIAKIRDKYGGLA